MGQALRRAPCLVFLHIPRTGGTTLSSSLVRSYRPDETLSLNILDKPLDTELGRIPSHMRAEANLIHGHMPFGVHAYMDRRCEYVTVLRNPLERVVSVYTFISRTPRHVLHERVVGTGTTLEAYVESGMDEGQTANSQTRQLSGRQFGSLDDAALEEAKRNLEGFLVIGLTERFEETFVMLRRAVRLRMPLYSTRNVSPSHEVSERALDLIRERNQLDLALHEFARDLFAQRIAQQSWSFGVEVSIYKALRPLSLAAGGKAAVLVRRLRGSGPVQR